MKQPYHLIFENSEQFKDYYLNDETEPIVYLPNFNTINIIVGANNSGKSRFIRELLKFKDLVLLDEEILENYNKQIVLYNSVQYFTPKLNFIDFRKFSSIIENNMSSINTNRYAKASSFKQRFVGLEGKLLNKFNNIGKYYIPTLRTAHSLYTAVHERMLDPRQTNSTYTRLDEDVYLETLRKNYALDNKLDVFTGLDLYEQVLNSRNAEKNVRDLFESFENFLSKNFFDGKQIDIVAKFNKSDSKQGKTDSELILIHIEGEKKNKEIT
ncbi:hypothetical protein [Flavobacterium sp.]|uniref:hypothetical protein n=1 Tax=Flavobacterium sp. TaxID=239 RepID=UPI003A900D98